MKPINERPDRYRRDDGDRPKPTADALEAEATELTKAIFSGEPIEVNIQRPDPSVDWVDAKEKTSLSDIDALAEIIRGPGINPPSMFAVGVGAKAPDGSDLAPGLYRNGPNGVECLEDWTGTDGDGVPSLHGVMSRLESVREIDAMHKGAAAVVPERFQVFKESENQRRDRLAMEKGPPPFEAEFCRRYIETFTTPPAAGLKTGPTPAWQGRDNCRRWPWYRRAWAKVRRFWPALCKQTWTDEPTVCSVHRHEGHTIFQEEKATPGPGGYVPNDPGINETNGGR